MGFQIGEHDVAKHEPVSDNSENAKGWIDRGPLFTPKRSTGVARPARMMADATSFPSMKMCPDDAMRLSELSSQYTEKFCVYCQLGLFEIKNRVETHLSDFTRDPCDFCVIVCDSLVRFHLFSITHHPTRETTML